MGTNQLKKVYLLDGMALIYRAFFAFQNNPIRNSRGENNSALFGFLNTLIEIREKLAPTHLGVAFDTSAPTFRHRIFPEYKAQREEMPEDLASALPRARELLQAMNIPVFILDGYEADDIIGTMAQRLASEDCHIYMVTPDKDFAQLVTPNITLFRPGRKGGDAEIMGPGEVCQKWEINEPAQIVDILGLWGDSSDNIPGVPGIGQKTAAKLIQKFGSIDGILANLDSLKGKQKENLEKFADQARLSRKLAEINTNVPEEWPLASLELQDFDEPALKQFLVEHEFNAIGKRLFGDSFKAGRGFESSASAQTGDPNQQGDLFAEDESGQLVATQGAALLTLADIPHSFTTVTKLDQLKSLIGTLSEIDRICIDTETTSLDARNTDLIGISWSVREGEAGFVFLPNDLEERIPWIDCLKPFFAREDVEWIGHNMKFDLHVLTAHGLPLRGKLFDTMIAHALIDPDQRHGMDFLSESLLGYSPISITTLIGKDRKTQKSMRDVPLSDLAEYAAEDAEVTFRLSEILRSRLSEKGVESVFRDIEMPLLPVLVSMERAGVAIDTDALHEISEDLQFAIGKLEKRIHESAGKSFNLNSPKQLGVVLFEDLKILAKPKKTKTGQYATNEQVLQSLAGTHPIVADILDYRGLTKLKSTYVDTLPTHVSETTGRVHTTFGQVMTATGRLQSHDPNLQNIPIRSDEGREIRRAFVPDRTSAFTMLAADYSQIELRIIASLSGDPGMREAFEKNLDIHAATASRVYGTPLDSITPSMRRNAKMVNFGIAYGITAFGLAQRLGIPRGEAKEIIDHYFQQFPGIRTYLDTTLEFARTHGYVETLCGRRRYIPDVNSGNATIRGAAERNAINMPIQGTAADMIKIAMARIHDDLISRKMKSRLILQVHDELVFEVAPPELETMQALITNHMAHAIDLQVPILVEIGTGKNWLEAH